VDSNYSSSPALYTTTPEFQSASTFTVSSERGRVDEVTRTFWRPLMDSLKLIENTEYINRGRLLALSAEAERKFKDSFDPSSSV